MVVVFEDSVIYAFVCLVFVGLAEYNLCVYPEVLPVEHGTWIIVLCERVVFIVIESHAFVLQFVVFGSLIYKRREIAHGIFRLAVDRHGLYDKARIIARPAFGQFEIDVE